MNALRILFRRHSTLAALIVALALALRVMVPGGFMPAFAQGGTVTIAICHGDGSSEQTIPVPVKKVPGSAQTCAFADLDQPTLGGVDAVLLALALAFIIALGFVASVPLRLRGHAHLRPPLRGPPSHA